MNDKRDFDRAVDRWLDDGSDATPPEVINAVLLAVRSTPQERRSWWPAWRTNRMTTYAKSIAAAAAVVVVVIVGYQFLPAGSGSGGTNATPSPSPVLLARGTFVIRDWGRVEFEATREGSTVTGRMAIGEGRGSGWPITVDLECTRMTEDGLIMIGGHVTDGPSNLSALDGSLAAIALKRGSPVEAQIEVGSGWPAEPTGNCVAYLDAWLTSSRRDSPGGEWLRDDIQGTVEFGP